MKRVLVLFGVLLICMLSFVACDKVTGSEAPVTSGIITRTEEDKIYDLTEEEVEIIADIIENGTWNTEGTTECANDCKLIIDERTYYYHSECGTFNDKREQSELTCNSRRERKYKCNISSIYNTWFRVIQTIIFQAVLFRNRTKIQFGELRKSGFEGAIDENY